MRKATIRIGLCILAFAVGSAAALADGINYTVSSTYGPSIPTTAITAPNANFSFTFTEPLPLVFTTVDASDFQTTVTATYSIGSTSITGPATVSFFLSPPTFASLSITPATNIATWTFSGPQLFSGTTSSPTLLPGVFPIGSYAFIIFSGASYNLAGGNVVATVPEPTSLLLLGTGLFGLFGAGRRRLPR